jgi:PAS domain S-box-containing protein
MTEPRQAAPPVPIDRVRDSSDDSEVFRLLVEKIRDYAIFVLDPAGNVVTGNAGAHAMKGYTRAEIAGKHFSRFYLPEAVQSGWLNPC